ncbi:MAG TPA: hypothetical protein VLF21_02020 [Candidatus Saccharimonadales bacterium]|nr:hypothetical protein [Candidatus Saccharimonadales bacterium]
MILSGPEIIQQRRRGNIWIEPFSSDQINPNSYNYRLGNEIIEFGPGLIDPKQPFKTSRHTISQHGFVLKPGRIYLAHTLERIGSLHFVTSLIGRSTMGRLGLWLQITADLGHMGANHHWTLELKVVQPLRIYAGMQIGQITFWKVQGHGSSYQGKYARDTSAEPSRIRFEL